MRNAPRIAPTITLATLALTPSALAQVDPGDLPGAQVLREEARAQQVDRGPVTVSLLGGGRGIFETDFDSGDATIATYLAQAGATLTWSVTDKLSLNFGLAYEAAFYDIEGGQEVFPALDQDDPFDTLHSTAFAMSGQWYLTDHWFILGAGTASAGWEPGADIGEAWTYGGFAGAGYKFSPQLSLALGVGGTTRLEDDARFYPFVSVRWQATERLLLETEGLGLRLTSKITDSFDAYLRGGYEGRSYRLDEDRTSAPNSALTDDGAFVAAGVTWKPLPGLRVSLEGGAVVYRELELRSDSGNKLSDEKTEVAPMVGLMARYSF